MFKLVTGLVKGSGAVIPKKNLRGLVARARLVRVGIAQRDVILPMLEANPATELGQLMSERPEMLGVLVWPYQCSAWGARERIERVVNHARVIDGLDGELRCSIEDRLVVADLGELFDGLKIMIDKPKWFMREGQLTANLFVDDFRAYSIAFSFYKEANGEISTVIGGVQGRNTEGVLDLYRDLTKALYGLRPRDLLLEVVRCISQRVGCTRMLGVGDQYRHHRHPYFGQKSFQTNYDEIWADREGVPEGEFFYRLSVEDTRRPLEEIKSKRRSMYRKRYAFLDEIEARFRDFESWETIRFVDR